MTPVVPPYRRGMGFGSLGVRFKEVFDPARVPLRPETFGAWLTLGLVAVLVSVGIAYFAWRHHHRRHRRAAERELRALGARWAKTRDFAALEAVPPLLKRCALQSFERAKVAPLFGERWLAFLATTSGAPFGAAAGRALVAITTRGAPSAAGSDVEELWSAARRWVRRHRAEL